MSETKDKYYLREEFKNDYLNEDRIFFHSGYDDHDQIGNFNDIEENEFIGILVNPKSFGMIIPKVLEGDLFMMYEPEDSSRSFPDSINTALKSLVVDDSLGIPLIVKKIRDNKVQEILSGEEFLIRTTGPDSIYGDIDWTELPEKEISFQNEVYRTIKDNNAYVDCMCSEHRWGYVKIDDYFKSLYADTTLEKKEDLVTVLKAIKDVSKKKFDEEEKKALDRLHKVAEVDNLLYDEKKSGKKNM
ncbi:MAG: hypothetical protein IJH20_03810 [Bacilli bacterium]|nr:hypothetical protein [Bacilli bacterium]